jgi:hypothetical protein
VFTSQKGSLGEVSEFFKVMDQVDRDLTTADYFDRLLGLIKNLGCHTRVSYVCCSASRELRGLME